MATITIWRNDRQPAFDHEYYSTWDRAQQRLDQLDRHYRNDGWMPDYEAGEGWYDRDGGETRMHITGGR